MNHAQLKAFHAVANKGGFTRAARHLGLTQPAVSQQVQALEQSYQIELFIRRGGTVSLTPCGERLLNISRRIFSLEEEAHLLLSSANELNSGILKIATDLAAPAYDLATAFHARHPNIHMSVSSLSHNQAVEGLLNYEIDIAIMAAPVCNLHIEHVEIERSPFGVILWQNHPLGARTEIRLADLAGEYLIHCQLLDGYRRQIDAALMMRDLTPRYIMTVQSLDGLCQLVANQVGIALLPSHGFAHDKRLTIKPLRDLQISTHICCYYLKERSSSRLIEAFRKVAAGGLAPDLHRQDARRRTC